MDPLIQQRITSRIYSHVWVHKHDAELSKVNPGDLDCQITF